MKLITAAVSVIFLVTIDASVFDKDFFNLFENVNPHAKRLPVILIITADQKSLYPLWLKKLSNIPHQDLIEHKKVKNAKGTGADYYDLDVGRSPPRDHEDGFPLLREDKSCADLTKDCIRYCLADSFCKKDNNIVYCASICPEECSKILACKKDP